MARPREFDPSDALNRAMMLFWQRGYTNASMADIVQATGVSRYGLYNEFGDKQDLFLKCVEHYANTSIDRALSPLEQANSSLVEIHAYFADLLTALKSEEIPLGCLIGNTAMLAIDETAVLELINAHYIRLKNAFANILQNSMEQGVLAVDSDIDALADYLVGIANGYLVCIRASMTTEAVQNYIQTALERFV